MRGNRRMNGAQQDMAVETAVDSYWGITVPRDTPSLTLTSSKVNRVHPERFLIVSEEEEAYGSTFFSAAPQFWEWTSVRTFLEDYSVVSCVVFKVFLRSIESILVTTYNKGKESKSYYYKEEEPYSSHTCWFWSTRHLYSRLFCGCL